MLWLLTRCYVFLLHTGFPDLLVGLSLLRSSSAWLTGGGSAHPTVFKIASKNQRGTGAAVKKLRLGPNLNLTYVERAVGRWTEMSLWAMEGDDWTAGSSSVGTAGTK